MTKNDKAYNYTLNDMLFDIQKNKYFREVRKACMKYDSKKQDINLVFPYTKEDLEYYSEMFESAEKHHKETHRALFEYFIGGITQEDIDDGNYESQYLYFHPNNTRNKLKLGQVFIVKSGHSFFDSYTTIKDTSKRSSDDVVVPLAVYYHPKRNSTKQLDDIYHPMID